MTDDLEARLRAALQPVEPPAGFSERIMQRLAARRRRARGWRVPAGVAAAVLIGIGVYTHLEQSREQDAGLEARRQVIEALRLTDEKLALASQAVRDESGT